MQAYTKKAEDDWRIHSFDFLEVKTEVVHFKAQVYFQKQSLSYVKLKNL